MDLDDEELEATRRLNGVAKDKIEGDIKIKKTDIDILNALINVYELKLPNYDKLMPSEVEVLKRVLAEREADKKKIKELEEALLKVKDKNTTLFITCRNSIPKQKVKEILDKAEVMDYYTLPNVIEDLEKLLKEGV